MHKYSYRQKTLTVDGRKIKQYSKESRAQYWERVKKLQEKLRRQ